jgi:hypothetical protein
MAPLQLVTVATSTVEARHDHTTTQLPPSQCLLAVVGRGVFWRRGVRSLRVSAVAASLGCCGADRAATDP